MAATPVFALSLVEALDWVPAGIGTLVAVVVFLALGLRWRTGRRARAEWARDTSAGWPSLEPSFGDRRGSLRREGPPVKVLLTSTSLRNGTEKGYVLDRSTGGLRVALKFALAAGTSLQVRANNAPDTVPWVTVTVRSCRDAGHHFELGCEFDRQPPWNVLLLFG